MSANKVILVGNLGRDPEMRHTQNGQAVATFSVATSRRWRDRESGEQREQTDWHRIVAWGRLAEICAEYLSKGKQVYIEGRLQTREWEDKDGNKRWTTEVIANDMQMLGRRGDAPHDTAAPPTGPGDTPAATPPTGPGDTPAAAPPAGDDIPF